MPVARVLVIEDNPTNLELMTYLLRAFGYEALTAMDGEEGIAAAERERPDLILCDIQLPRLDGYGVVRRLKESPRLKETPVIAVTAYAMVSDRERMLKAGFDHYLSKPIVPETFVEQVAQHLPRTKRASAPRLEAMAEPAPAPEPPGAAPPSKGLILVVDNTRMNIQIAQGTLGPLGYQVVGAGGMAEALEIARTERPDLILSDLNMPEGSGYDLLERAKREPALRDVPFVLISSSFWGIDEAQAKARGAAMFIQRPIEPTEFVAKLEPLLGKKGG